jgi:hypothetical protein
MLTQVRIRKDDNLELIGLMIFDYFELREIVNMGKVSRVFYELTGRKEVLNKFFPSVSKKLSKTSIIVESLDNEYGASLSKKPL